LEGIAMDSANTDRATFTETTVYLSYFKETPDHRPAGKIIYPPDEILHL
jgi:hypothetical protein